MGRPRRTLSQGPWQGGKAGRGARARDREASGSPAPLETGAPAGAPIQPSLPAGARIAVMLAAARGARRRGRHAPAHMTARHWASVPAMWR